VTKERRIEDYEKLIEVTEREAKDEVEDKILDDLKLDMIDAHRLLAKLHAKFEKKREFQAEEPEINNHAAFVAQHLRRNRDE